MPAPIYNLGLFGSPTVAERDEIRDLVAAATQPLRITLGNEIAIVTNPDDILSNAGRTSASAFFVAPGAPDDGIAELICQGVPIIPVLRQGHTATEIPQLLRHVNALDIEKNNIARLVSALLECASLLPTQRRIFLSYRRTEGREAALQMFDALSERQFDVFLDTHGVPPAADFQFTLWHRLCDSDILVMLDTPGYFASRWTSAEFGRALAKSVTVLRVGWPDTARSARTGVADNISLTAAEIDAATGRLVSAAIEKICVRAETNRSEGLAVRRLNFLSRFRQAVVQIGGSISGVGPHHAIHVTLPDGKTLTAYPSLGIPSAVHLHQAQHRAPPGDVVVVYDPIGLNKEWVDHLEWLGVHIKPVRWLKSHETAWALADWV